MDKEVKDIVVDEEANVEETKLEEKKEEVKPKATVSPLVDVSEIPVEITAVLGDTEMTLSELMELGKGSFIELNTYEDNNVKLLANGKLIAYGIVLAVDQNFGVQITKIVE